MFSKVNDAYESVKNGLEAQIALATAEEKSRLADAKIALSELKDLISDLKEENRTLRDRILVKDSLKPELGHSWLFKENDDDPSRRYCQICYYDRDKVIPLDEPTMSTEHYFGQRYCQVC